MSEASERPEGSDQGPKRRGKAKKRHTVGMVILSTMLTLTLVTGLGAVAVYRSITSNIDGSDAMEHVDNRPEDFDTGPKKAVRILVMASDTRDGEDNKIDNEEGGLSDTTILLHISADRTRAYGISIPRDSIVDRPACGPDNSIPEQSEAMWNAAYKVGGEGCTVEQFEQSTGVRVDGFVTIDFAGFKDMVDAIDGVPICLPFDVNDDKAKIYLKAGEREVMGDEALDYVRVRNIGDGTDIGRISRQQTFIASMVKKVSSAGTLARPDRVLGFLSAVAKSLTISDNINNTKQLAGIALSLQNIGMSKVQFVTVPFSYFPRGHQHFGRVAWTDQADELWERVKFDRPLGPELTSKAISADRAPGGRGDGGGGKGGKRGPSEDEKQAAEFEARCA
ncbi:LCP family protein [Nocardioides sp. Y6]|uniref:LCP family protein n=1 Tax=Nocardioides malaquae TaxID=2773426 RepID=A0ABR9RUX1_9ACTN|nr:LCP family protein [Nocardioides malaquae]MBE7325356.1 LCP family protein [Nocardioides malaquae]